MMAIVPEAFTEAAASCPRWQKSLLEYAIIQLHAWQRWQSVADTDISCALIFIKAASATNLAAKPCRYKHDDR